MRVSDLENSENAYTAMKPTKLSFADVPDIVAAPAVPVKAAETPAKATETPVKPIDTPSRTR